MENENEKETKRVNEKAAKVQFQEHLANVFNVDNGMIDIKNQTTDVILKLGNDEKDWLYFELKCTTDKVLGKNKKYFGAISMNQWLTYYDHKKNYYFVIAVEGGNGIFRYAIISPESVKKYLTGIYEHTDFSIPKDILEDKSIPDIKTVLQTIKENEFVDKLKDIEGKHDLIEKLNRKLENYKLNHQ